MYSQIAANKRRTILIMFLFFVLVSALAWAVTTFALGEPSLTVFVLIFAAGYALFSYFNAGKMALLISGAREITQTDEPRYYRTVENLCITDGLPMPKLYVIDDPALNAFASGRDPAHAVLAATSGLLSSLTDTELEGVIAHELGHVQNYDIRVSMIAFALVTVVSMISDFVLRWMWFSGDDEEGGAGAVGIVIVLVAAILAPFVAIMLQLAISRQREYLADATGALTTRYPEGLISALTKIQQQGSQLQKQSSATAHLYFANPLKKSMIAGLFSTHPPVEERIARLQQMGNQL